MDMNILQLIKTRRVQKIFQLASLTSSRLVSIISIWNTNSPKIEMKTNINFTLPLLLCFLVFLSSSDARPQTPLIKNGYHVLVGIHEDVKEDLGIIDNLKEILTQASKRIYNGTQNRAYFRTVSVPLPTT